MEIKVRDFITLGQLLKVAGIGGSGGEIKAFLSTNSPLVNGEPENRRGRKLRAGDVVVVSGHGEIKCIPPDPEST